MVAKQLPRFAGVDASDQFAAFHRPRVYGRLPQYFIGEAAAFVPGFTGGKVFFNFRGVKLKTTSDKVPPQKKSV